ncbi:MAG: hypothetical protein ACK5NN_09425 [Sphingomonadaceae bacterium]
MSKCADEAGGGLLGGGSGSSTKTGSVANAPTSATCASAAKCGCNGVFKAQNPFARADKCDWIDQLDLNGRSKGRGTGGLSWNADVFLDMPNKQITVTHRINFVNKTGDSSYGAGGRFPYAAPLSQEDFSKRVNKIPDGIRKWWNSKPYRIRIKDRMCGDNIYRILFNPQIVSSNPHYTIYTYNIPYDVVGDKYIFYANGDKNVPLPPRSKVDHPLNRTASLGRSFVQPHSSGSWNLADTRTCTDVAQRGHTQYHDMLEVHEYAHMLGLPDVYRDDGRQINGAMFRTRGDIGTNADTVVMASSAPGSPVTRMLGNMQNTSDYDKSYALTVAKVVTRHMHEVWGHRVEDWEILS